jgi:hypothetical protein
MQIFKCSYFLLIFFFFSACQKASNEPATDEKTFEYNFSSGTEGWTGDFADYPNEPGVEQFYQLEFSHTGLPAPLNTTDGTLRLSGINKSDDLFMFIKKKITGLEAGKKYTVNLTIDFATDVANNMVGIGGSPGESVFVKAGAVALEPKKMINTSENWFRMNIDKNNQSNSGNDMKVIGNFANGTNVNTYTIKQLSTITPITVQANPQGEIWLVVGTDSGFEGRTTIYYNSVKATIK